MIPNLSVAEGGPSTKPSTELAPSRLPVDHPAFSNQSRETIGKNLLD
jgi:hypothetical protein